MSSQFCARIFLKRYCCFFFFIFCISSLLALQIIFVSSASLRFVSRMNHSSPLNEVPDPNQANQCMKVFVQRDYSDGTMIKFQTRFPPELEDKVCMTNLDWGQFTALPSYSLHFPYWSRLKDRHLNTQLIRWMLILWKRKKLLAAPTVKVV